MRPSPATHPRRPQDPHRRRIGRTKARARILALLALLAASGVALPQAARALEAEALLVDGRLGPSFLLDSKSNALNHLFKPGVRLGARFEVGRRLELGASALGLLSPNAHYRVLGLLAHGRYGLWQRPTFSLGLGAGLGVGKDADIQNADLRADHTVMPYGFVGLDARWTVGRHWHLGVELAFENLSLLSLGIGVGRRLPLLEAPAP